MSSRAATSELVLSVQSASVDSDGLKVEKIEASKNRYMKSRSTLNALNAVVVSDGETVESPVVLSHGAKEQNMKVLVCQPSTKLGQDIPPAWNEEGKMSDVYLTKACSYDELAVNGKLKTEKFMNTTTETVTADGTRVSTLSDEKKPRAYFERLLESDQELKKLHASHIHRESKAVSFEAIAQTFGPTETVLRKIMCKAIINTPSTGYDVIGDSWLVMTEVKTGDTANKLRRIYFFQVLGPSFFSPNIPFVPLHPFPRRILLCCLYRMHASAHGADRIQHARSAAPIAARHSRGPDPAAVHRPREPTGLPGPRGGVRRRLQDHLRQHQAALQLRRGEVQRDHRELPADHCPHGLPQRREPARPHVLRAGARTCARACTRAHTRSPPPGTSSDPAQVTFDLSSC
jgi:hypothetical protein